MFSCFKGTQPSVLYTCLHMCNLPQVELASHFSKGMLHGYMGTLIIPPPSICHAKIKKAPKECNITLGLSFASEKDWTKHVDSTAHKTNVCKAAAILTTKISSFFTKKVTPTASSSTSTSLTPIHLFPTIPNRGPVRLAPLSNDPHPITLGEVSSTHITLLNRFKAAINALPLVIPIGINSEDLAAFSGNPVALIDPDNKPWEVLDQVLNWFGRFGMDGMYDWVKACVEGLHIGEALPKGKIQQLIEAMELVKHLKF
ncbi:uncharacterized protein LACBIDRAFT_333030 [Laccaria bicolor S238N-H82]|uniref:Predicted protein n=1 Tax=Laccaria bicolor (strain S238N-H82 / ATCC MYA-4686) TaxID=486041 RepID=B0DUL9_LACBS|nr:uncharacterized protein LACBIDRAFT_333029 [Laccaria bicolor S238N-H82]XP_001887580.1 uncharacterized protein LACBIDRAFT_333030 [Laccaria bicolor S238N-H82]EDR01766.1 predicted protein [Laccaria bicolor S238N-H82]EDR01767.1 predicted protein [Laccaria bicolor S238N-H82]|eukprot:XP_001887579.1 predicted protein [Laccaria bicolor S238N-H82]